MSGVGTVLVNGKRRPRVWCVSMLIELSPDLSEAQAARLRAVEMRLNRLRCDSSKSASHLIAALEALAVQVEPGRREGTKRGGAS